MRRKSCSHINQLDKKTLQPQTFPLPSLQPQVLSQIFIELEANSFCDSPWGCWLTYLLLILAVPN